MLDEATAAIDSQTGDFVCDVLRYLVPSVQLKKREKHPWLRACNFTKSSNPPWVLLTFLNCTNGTKWCNVSHLYISNHISYLFYIIL